ncbi:hypothetical protein AB0L17_36265, partial [Streptomyces cellulosae]
MLIAFRLGGVLPDGRVEVHGLSLPVANTKEHPLWAVGPLFAALQALQPTLNYRPLVPVDQLPQTGHLGVPEVLKREVNFDSQFHVPDAVRHRCPPTRQQYEESAVLKVR